MTCILSIGRSVKEQPRWNSMAAERGSYNNHPPHIMLRIGPIRAEAVSSNAFTLCDPVTLTFDLLTSS